MAKPQRKAAARRGKHVPLADLIADMPIAPGLLHKLLDHLDAHLQSCDHTPKLTTDFLHAEKLDKDKVLPWLAEQGGYCDCEVLANLTDLDELLQAPPPGP
jgi:Protein of unknown function (DUF2695)